MKTVESNLQTRCEGIIFDSSAATFQDAATITRKLGIKYLWIDALCIIQGDEDDWRRESMNMNYVYQHATVTITSEASPKSSIGIEDSMKPARRPSSMLPWALSRCENKSLQGKIYFRESEEPSRGPLSNRAWTLQEEVLSPRIIRFAEQQVLWRCCSEVWSEWEPGRGRTFYWEYAETWWNTVQPFRKSDSGHEIIPSRNMSKAILDFWYMSIVNHYVSRQVTYPRDRLMALLGITREIQNYLPEPEFIAGIWAADIHSGLAWHAPVANTKAYPAYDAPSWSWTHLDYGAIRGVHCFLYEYWLVSSITPLAEISIEELRPVNELGSASGRAALKMRSQCLLVCACKIPVAFFDQKSSSSQLDDHYQLSRVSQRKNDFINRIGAKTLAEEPCYTTDHKQSRCQYLYLQLLRYEPDPIEPNWSDEVPIPVIVALILKECGNRSNPEYQRVGRALIPTDPSRPFSWPVQELKVV
ncbi:hypothetical protein LTR10_004398 [Elasticomyces elasticus]|nr:hypothetical protein LTR10_004398 [Elasticomyces elasticus]KAK4976715.1 hypothetical protein LTR42_002760 [Elasticomyces elasticus]